MNDMVSMRKMAPCAEFVTAGLGAADSGAGGGEDLGFGNDFLGGNERSLSGAESRER